MVVMLAAQITGSLWYTDSFPIRYLQAELYLVQLLIAQYKKTDHPILHKEDKIYIWFQGKDISVGSD
jgi:hypothetical protein